MKIFATGNRGSISYMALALVSFVTVGTVYKFNQNSSNKNQELQALSTVEFGYHANQAAIRLTTLLFRSTALLVKNLSVDHSTPVIWDSPTDNFLATAHTASGYDDHETWKLLVPSSGSEYRLQFDFCNMKDLGNKDTSQLFLDGSSSFHDENCNSTQTYVTFDKVQDKLLYITAKTTYTASNGTAKTKTTKARIKPFVESPSCTDAAGAVPGDIDGDGSFSDQTDFYQYADLFSPPLMPTGSSSDFNKVFKALGGGTVDDVAALAIPTLLDIPTAAEKTAAGVVNSDFDGDCKENNNTTEILELLETQPGIKDRFDTNNACDIRFYYKYKASNPNRYKEDWAKTGDNYHGGSAANCDSGYTPASQTFDISSAHADSGFRAICGPFLDINNSGAVDSTDYNMLKDFLAEYSGDPKMMSALYIQTPHEYDSSLYDDFTSLNGNNYGTFPWGPMQDAALLDANGDCLIDEQDLYDVCIGAGYTSSTCGTDPGGSSGGSGVCSVNTNSTDAQDVNNDGHVNGVDLLQVKQVSESKDLYSNITDGEAPFFDVDGDCVATQSDTSSVVNDILLQFQTHFTTAEYETIDDYFDAAP